MRKPISSFLIVALMLTMLPTVAFADGTPEPPAVPATEEVAVTQEVEGNLEQNLKIIVEPAAPKVVVRPKIVVNPTPITVKAPSVLVKPTFAPNVVLPEMKPTFRPNIIIPAPETVPLHKDWRLWTGVGAGVAVIGIVLAIVLTRDTGGHDTNVDVGNGYGSGAAIRF